MAGFTDRDQYINAKTVSGFGQDRNATKVAPASFTGLAHWTFWAGSGLPPAGAYSGTALEAQQVTSSTTGAFGFTAAGGSRELFLTGAIFSSTTGTGTLILYDRLLYYPGIDHTVNTSQTLTNPVALPRYTSGAGVMAWLEVTSALGATAQNCTLTYTDQGGTASNSTGAQTITASSAQHRLPHSFLFFPLAAGDTGIRSVQSVQFSAANSAGTSALVLGRILAYIPISTAGVSVSLNLFDDPNGLKQLEDNAALSFLWTSAATATPTIQGMLEAVEN